MHKNPEYVFEVSLKGLFFSMLFRWRSILITALIGAALLGTYQYLNLESVHQQGKRTEEERQFEIDYQTYHTSLETYQNDIETYTKLIAARKEYRDNSPYLQLDPQNICTAERRYYVEVDQSVLDAMPSGSTIDPADYILSVYAAAMREQLDDAELEDVFGTANISYVDELASVISNAEDNTIVVTARGGSKEAAEKELAYIAARIDLLCDGKAQEVNRHQLIQVNENVTVSADNELLTTKNQIKTDIANYQKTLDAAIKGLNDLEIEEEPEAPGNHIKKMAAIGFMLGAFFLAGIYAVQYLLNGKLTDGEALSEQYGVPVFGEYYRTEARRPGKAPDKWFVSLERGKTTPDDDSVTAHIAALIRERAADGDILLVSTEKEEALLQFKNCLLQKLGGRGISCCADFLNNADAVPAASKAEAVILVETKNASYLKNIDRMAELLITCEAKVIGAIVL